MAAAAKSPVSKGNFDTVLKKCAEEMAKAALEESDSLTVQSVSELKAIHSSVDKTNAVAESVLELARMEFVPKITKLTADVDALKTSMVALQTSIDNNSKISSLQWAIQNYNIIPHYEQQDGFTNETIRNILLFFMKGQGMILSNIPATKPASYGGPVIPVHGNITSYIRSLTGKLPSISKEGEKYAIHY
jgi:hypothetical protein